MGQSTTITATAVFSDGSAQQVAAAAVWATSAPGTATVNGGVVTGVGPGSATISATYQGQTATAQVTVAAQPVTVTVTGVSIGGTLSLPVGGSTQLTVRASRSDGTSVDVTAQAAYQSNNGLVSVSASGQVSGLAAGAANITATYQGFSAQVQVQVNAVAPTVTGITISGGSSVKLLQLLNLTAVATLSDGTTQTVTGSATWSSSNPALLELASSGVLRGLVVGNVTVTVTYQGHTTQKTVTVTL